MWNMAVYTVFLGLYIAKFGVNLFGYWVYGVIYPMWVVYLVSRLFINKNEKFVAHTVKYFFEDDDFEYPIFAVIFYGIYFSLIGPLTYAYYWAFTDDEIEALPTEEEIESIFLGL